MEAVQSVSRRHAAPGVRVAAAQRGVAAQELREATLAVTGMT